MREKLVSFETAKLAKEKGFDWECNNWWVETLEYKLDIPRSGVEHFPSHEPRILGHKPSGNYHIIHASAPSQSLLQRWLREVHKINVESNYLPNIQKYSCLYIPMTGKASIKDNIYVSKIRFDIYEEALEEGLYQALNLIK